MPPPPKPAKEKKPTAGASRKRKAAMKAEDVEDSVTAAAATPPAPPSTPPPKGRRKTAAAASVGAADPPPPPATPTPSVVGLISEPLGRPSRRHPAVTRVADPRATNAALLSPETSRVVVSARPPVEDLSPVKPSAAAAAAATAVVNDGPAAAQPETATTTANILEEACAHLIRVDPRMRPLVKAHHCHMFSPEGLAEQIDPFESLCSGIISQQVSGAAARSIKAKFVALFSPPPSSPTPPSGDDDTDTATEPNRRFPQPSQVAAASLERLRTAGLSQRKAEYVRGLAERFVSGELSAAALADAPYDEVIARLTAVRGLGLWSAEMFACFGLKRMDVFSLGDLGVQRGMAAFVGRDIAKLKAAGKGGKWKYMSEADMRELSDRFRPYRSLFMWYMWRVEETDVSTME